METFKLSYTAKEIDEKLSQVETAEQITNKVTALDENATDDQYPSAKAVFDYVDEAIGDFDPSDLVTVTTPDWEQGDETQSDFIKNKPFYEVAAKTRKLIFNTFTDKQNGSFYQESNDIAIDPIFLSDKIAYDVKINDTVYENQPLRYFGGARGYYGFGNASLWGKRLNASGENTGENWCIYFQQGREHRLCYVSNQSFARDDGTVYVEVVGKVEEKTTLLNLPTVATAQDAAVPGCGVGVFNAPQNLVGSCLGNKAIFQVKIDDEEYKGQSFTFIPSEGRTVAWIGNATIIPTQTMQGVIYTDTEEDFAILYNGLDEDDNNGDGDRTDKKFAFAVRGLEDGIHSLEISILGFVEIKQINDKYFKDRDNVEASGYMAHATGIRSKATGVVAYAEGIDTLASNESAHAEGANTIAAGARSHAEGSGAQATGEVAHAEGFNTKAEGVQSHAEGCETVTKAQGAHAEGVGTVASSFVQHVQGRYNVEDANTQYLHIVGNGENESNRHNAHTVDWVGNGWFAGKVLAKDIIIENADGSNAITSLLAEINNLKAEIRALKS